LIHYVEIGLYLLAIVLASYALWERFPAETHPPQKLALAGALLTLFLTFFVTSLRIDDIKDVTDKLNPEIRASPQEKRLRALKDAPDPVARAALDLLDQERDSILPLHENGSAILNEDEGVRLIGLIVERLARTDDAKSLKISAISTNPNEFKDSPIKGYEQSLEKAAEKMSEVQRIYVLSDDAFIKTQAWFERETKPLNIYDWIQNEPELRPVVSHYLNGIRFLLAPRSALGAKPLESDLILVTREQNVILGANRINDAQLQIVWNNPEKPTPNLPGTIQKWLGNFIFLVSQPKLVRFPKYEREPNRLSDNKIY
jgi:hypothetical protein